MSIPFSVIIPVYNRAIKLKRSIASAKQAAHAANVSIEIVVVDDASSDDSANVARSAGADIVLALQTNVGVTGARNRGIARASGDLLVFLDSDDELARDAFIKIGEHFDRYPSTDVLFGACLDRVEKSMHHAKTKFGPVTYRHFLVHSAPGEFLPVVKKGVFRTLLFEEKLRGFEGITWLKAARSGYVLYYSPEILRIYDKEGIDRLCRRENILRGANRLAIGWNEFVCEFGVDLWNLSKPAYTKAVIRWAVYERLQSGERPTMRLLPPNNTAAARGFVNAIKALFRLVPRGILVRLYSAR